MRWTSRWTTSRRYSQARTSPRSHDDQVTAKPIRVLHGTSDDYNPIAPCRAYVGRLSKLATTTRCVLAEGDGGVIMNEETRQPFNYGDACVVKGPTLAYHEAASKQAREYVRTFLRGIFALK